MQAMICELCGSTDLVKQDGMFVCQNCGAKYTVEEARKLLGEVPSNAVPTRAPVKQEDDKVNKLLLLARRAREDNNSENAEKYYDMLLIEQPDNWEAAFFQVYYKAMQCKIMNIASAATSVSNSLDGTLALIRELPDKQEQISAANTVYSYSNSIARMLASAAKSHYVKNSTVSGVFGEAVNRIVASCNIYLTLETVLKKHLPDCKEQIARVQEGAFDFIVDYKLYFNADWRSSTTARLANEIKAFNPSFSKTPIIETPSAKKGGCYVATAVYGSYDCPEVWTLRRYRDDTLAKTRRGRAFIRTYYAISPTLVRWFGSAEWFRRMWKPKLDRMVARLRSEGVEDTPYHDKKW